MSVLRARAPQSREKRLDAISAYYGSAAKLAQEFGESGVSQRIRTFAQSTEDDLLYALRLLAGIREAVTVIHGPRGCAAAELLLGSAGPWATTNLDERDTIMGSDAKLRRTVTDLHRRYRPRIVFIVATPVVAINNDDIQSVVEELNEELDTVIVPVYAEGFKSKSAVTGYDVALHAVVKYLIPRGEGERGDFVNLVSVAEKKEDRLEVLRLLGHLGAEVNVLPDGARREEIARAPAARLTVDLDPDAGNYLGSILESEFAVPYLRLPRPVGIAATGTWLAALGEALGLAPESAELHRRESASLAPLLGSRPLSGLRLYLSLPASDAAGAAALVTELGGEVAGITVEHLDRLHDGSTPGLQELTTGDEIHVGHGQSFEEANILQRLQPDLYVGASGHQALAARLGIPVVSLDATPLLGYAGVAAFARSARKALKNRAFVRLLNGQSPYSENWLRRSPHWHIKQEVK